MCDRPWSSSSDSGAPTVSGAHHHGAGDHRGPGRRRQPPGRVRRRGRRPVRARGGRRLPRRPSGVHRRDPGEPVQRRSRRPAARQRDRHAARGVPDPRARPQHRCRPLPGRPPARRVHPPPLRPPPVDLVRRPRPGQGPPFASCDPRTTGTRRSRPATPPTAARPCGARRSPPSRRCSPWSAAGKGSYPVPTQASQFYRRPDVAYVPIHDSSAFRVGLHLADRRPDPPDPGPSTDRG